MYVSCRKGHSLTQDNMTCMNEGTIQLLLPLSIHMLHVWYEYEHVIASATQPALKVALNIGFLHNLSEYSILAYQRVGIDSL